MSVPLLTREERPAALASRSGSGWRPALLLARRELLRAPGRTLLVLLMVLLPVTAVVALDTLLRTTEVDQVEGLPRELGDAQARIDPAYDAGPVEQSPDLTTQGSLAAQPTPSPQPTRLRERELLRVLPAGSRLLEVREGRAAAFRAEGDRSVRAVPVAVDLRDEQLRGPYTVLRGRAPATATEVAVTPRLEREGLAAGSTLRLPDGSSRTVTGTVASPSSSGVTRGVVGLPDAVGVPATAAASRVFVSGPPVTWDDVREVNALGAFVLSRAVLLDPPPDDQVPQLGYGYDDGAATTAAIVGLIAVIAVLEVVLLAGPAFAVGARRQRRTLALLAATGGEPRHVRRVVLAQGLLVGLTAVAVGLPLGVLAAAAVGEVVTRRGGDWGPFDVSLRDLLLVGLLGALTALLAALWPAHVTARQPVVAALQGRRLVPARAAVPTLLGVALLALGLVGTVLALRGVLGLAELAVAFAAVPTVLGAVLLAPALLAGLGRLAGRLPLPLRFAVRDADRQRGRTAPAVAAITATVAGVVALGVANTSDAREQRLAYAPVGAVGSALVDSYEPTDWRAVERAVRDALPGEPVATVPGLRVSAPESGQTVQVCAPGEPEGTYCTAYSQGGSGSTFGSELLVGPEALDALAPLLRPASLAAAQQVVASGGVAVTSPRAFPPGEVEVRRQRVEPRPDAAPAFTTTVEATVPAVALQFRSTSEPVRAVLSRSVARQVGTPATVALTVGDDLTEAQEQALTEAVLAAAPEAQVQVERGFDERGQQVVVLLLFAVGGLLVLGGTLAATSLALAEAHPDLATLGSVGARPRTRRAVAAAYALVLAGTGAALGVLAGLLPGLAAAVTLTRGSSGYLSYDGGGSLLAPASVQGHVIDMPWLLLLALLVGVPLVAAAVTALTSSRRPPAARRLRA